MRQGVRAALINIAFEIDYLKSRAAEVKAGADAMRAKLENGEVPEDQIKGYREEITSEDNLYKLKLMDVEKKESEYAQVKRKGDFLTGYKG